MRTGQNPLTISALALLAVVASIALAAPPAPRSGEEDGAVKVEVLWKDETGAPVAKLVETSKTGVDYREVTSEVEAPGGHRFRLRSRVETRKDLWSGALLDRETGWEARLTITHGWGDLGPPEGVTFDQVYARILTEKTDHTYRIDLPGGRHEIVVPATSDSDPIPVLARETPLELWGELPATVVEAIEFSRSLLDSGSRVSLKGPVVAELIEVLEGLVDRTPRAKASRGPRIEAHWSKEEWLTRPP